MTRIRKLIDTQAQYFILFYSYINHNLIQTLLSVVGDRLAFVLASSCNNGVAE